MAQGERLYFRADEETRDEVAAFQRQHGFEDRSKACRELIEVGLREQRNPIIWRLKDSVVEWCSTLAIAAVVVFITGATTDVVAFRDGVVVAATCVVVATALLAGFETARVVTGVNAVGVKVREVLGKVKA